MSNASKGKISKAEWLKIVQAREKLSKANIFIDDSSMITPQQMISKCRRLKSRFGLDLVMVDYIQLMTPDKARSSDSRQNEISDISRYLKILAKELNVPVLALSQLNRAVESRKGRPQLSDLRESGAIEQDADIVMFIHRPDKNATEKERAEGKIQENVAEILVEKHRNGPTGMVKLYFQGECTKFLNLNEETGEPEEENENSARKSAIRADKDYEDLPIPPEKEEKLEDLPFEAPAFKSVDDEIF
jgi:replicative DNA helicase